MNNWHPYLIKAMKSLMKHWETWDEESDQDTNLAFFSLDSADELTQIYFLSPTDIGEDGIIRVDCGDYPTRITTYLDNGIEYYIIVDETTRVVKEG